MQCQCRKCLDTADAGLPWFKRRTISRMVLCETCGCKRCPHANSHEHACTASNELGQPGSAYEHAEPSRSQKLSDAGYTRRPSWRSLPSDE